MPMLMMLRIGMPGMPRHIPERTFSEKSVIRSRTSCTSATTSTPSTISEAPLGMRNATCSTERFSEVLMRSPAHIASRCRSSVPGETILIAASVYAGAGRLNVIMVGVSGFAAAVIGDNIGFAIGHYGGRAVVLRWGRYVRLTGGAAGQGRDFLQQARRLD